jgi:putative aldouronate transport system permease protein
VSFSSKAAISAGSVGVFPVDAQLRAYGFIIKESRFWTAFLISVERTVLGITINMLLVILAAYPLSKPSSFFRADRFTSGSS